MPLTPINYENTCIYKLCCNNPEVIDVYVGSTTDMIRRKQGHKNLSNTNKDYNVYNFINANGGWSNWSMILVEQFSCKNSYEAKAREREYIVSLNATLNSYIPNRTREEYYIEKGKVYNLENKTEIAAYKKAYQEKNKSELAAKKKVYQENNKIKLAAYRKAYYQKTNK